MGILSAVKSIGKAIISKAGGKVVSKSNPVSTFISEIPSVQGVEVGKSTARTSFKDAIVGGLKKGVSNIAEKIVSNPVKTLTAVAIGGPVAVGILSKSSARDVISKIPEKSFEAGEKIGEVIGGETPISELTTKDVLKTGAVVGTGVAVLGAGALLVDKVINKEDKDGVLGTDDNLPAETGGSGISATPSVPISQSPTASQPQGIATENISTGTSKKRRSTRLKTSPSPIVRVNNKVIVNNKNYLKNK